MQVLDTAQESDQPRHTWCRHTDRDLHLIGFVPGKPGLRLVPTPTDTRPYEELYLLVAVFCSWLETWGGGYETKQ